MPQETDMAPTLPTPKSFEYVLFFSVNTLQSHIIKSPDANATINLTDAIFLGRPWNDLATTVYLRTFMEDIIKPAGWTPFDSARYILCVIASSQLDILYRPVIMNTTFYAEFDSMGTRTLALYHTLPQWLSS